MKHTLLALSLLSFGSFLFVGCSSTAGSTATGAALGAAGGWALGNKVGGSEAGYLGAVAGGVAGSVVGFFSAESDDEAVRTKTKPTTPRRPRR